MTASGKAVISGWLVLAFSSSTAFAQQHFATRLDTVPIDARNQMSITGNGAVRARLENGELTVQGEFFDLAGPATVARLHVGSATGARGPSVRQLTVTQEADGRVSGVIRLSEAETEALNAGRLYVQIHSESAPDGNLWGWLLPQEPAR